VEEDISETEEVTMLVDPAIGAILDIAAVMDTSPHGEHTVVVVALAEVAPMEHRMAVATGAGRTAVVIVADMVAADTAS
jgi:hypothetical protein